MLLKTRPGGKTRKNNFLPIRIIKTFNAISSAEKYESLLSKQIIPLESWLILNSGWKSSSLHLLIDGKSQEQIIYILRQIKKGVYWCLEYMVRGVSLPKLGVIRQVSGNWTKLDIGSRVANVVADHDDLLTQWRLIKMSKFAPIFFWYELLPTTSGPRKFSKIRGLKVTYFHFPITKNIPN